MKLKKLVTCVLAAAIAVGGVITGVGNYPLTDANVVLAAETTVYRTQLESAYVMWRSLSGADGYNVYIKPQDGSYTQLDPMLIRQYNDYFRADAVGLKPGKYVMKVVPTSKGKENESGAYTSDTMTVEAYDRSGFSWVGGTSSGAYNEDGTLKSNAVVVYVTDKTKDTVKANLNVEGKGEVECEGIQNIILGYKKGKETRPLALRIIGNITDPAVLTKGDLYVDSAKAGMTIEGIGNDATFNGFGLVLKNCSNVEVRNLGFMNCNSDEGDNCGLQQGNDHCWVHNCDFFYGEPGSDSDQVKGDGALDTKKSHHITHSYNHFFDNGKCNLQGANASDTSNYITYHHNWYDHSDSRHPRVRVATVHVYNNYYDGNAKYGIGATTDSDVFAENNYFRNCKNPMLISKQGSEGGLVLSGETGGMIKAYGNVIVGAEKFVSYKENNTDFDAYTAASRDEKVPESVKAKEGGAVYNNFDTASDMYKYTVDKAEEVPAKVMANAGRKDGGDFRWQFDNSVDDASYVVNAGLKAALLSYKDSIIAIGSGFKDASEIPPATESVQPTQPPATSESKPPVTTAATTASENKSTTVSSPTTIVSGAIYCSPKADSSGNGTKDDPVDVLTAISKVQPGGVIYLLGGRYSFKNTIMIDDKNCGTADKYKVIMAYPGEYVIWDFMMMEVDPSNRGVVLDGDYWWFKGFEITQAGDNGMLLSGNNNVISDMVFSSNQDTGLQISRYNSSAETIKDWPSNNLILNCTSKNNCDDATMENADGFAAKLTCGEGNVFDGCMAYNNSDDGWDLFAKTATGSIGVVTIRNCMAFRNGYTEFGKGFGDCDGNGFKLGGSGVGTAHIVENCIAFENLHCGFTDNNNPKLGSLTNCTAYNNGVDGNGKPNVSCYRCTDGCAFSKMLTYINNDKLKELCDANPQLNVKAANDKFVGTIEKSIYYNSGYYYVDAKTAIGNGDKIGEKVAALTVDDFVSLDVPAYQNLSNVDGGNGYDFHTLWRNANGTINTHGFLELKSTSKYAGMGASMQNVVLPALPTLNTDPNPVTTTAVTTSPTVSTTTIISQTSSSIGTTAESQITVVSAETTSSMETMAASTRITTIISATNSTICIIVTVPNTGTTVSDKPVSTTVKTTSTTTVPVTEDLPDGTMYGDVNLDGRVNVSDVVALNLYLLNKESNPIDINGRANADCKRDNVINTADSTLLMNFVAEIIQATELGKK